MRWSADSFIDCWQISGVGSASQQPDNGDEDGYEEINFISEGKFSRVSIRRENLWLSFFDFTPCFVSLLF